MKNIIKSTKTKLVLAAVFFAVAFALGAYARPGIDTVGEITGALFTTKQVYAAPVSEYETKVNELWHSDKHQSTCRSNAAAVIALQLAHKYVEIGERESALSNYDLPMTEAVKKTSEYGKR